MDAIGLLERAKKVGLTVRLQDDKTVKVSGRATLEAEAIVDELRRHKTDILSYLANRSSNSWVLEEWRRCSIPHWRSILAESEKANHTARAKYAKWMLEEVLEDDGG